MLWPALPQCSANTERPEGGNMQIDSEQINRSKYENTLNVIKLVFFLAPEPILVKRFGSLCEVRSFMSQKLPNARLPYLVFCSIFTTSILKSRPPTVGSAGCPPALRDTLQSQRLYSHPFLPHSRHLSLQQCMYCTAFQDFFLGEIKKKEEKKKETKKGHVSVRMTALKCWRGMKNIARKIYSSGALPQF